MRQLRGEDPADVVVAWEAVEELLAAIPENASKLVLRLLAAGLATEEIAERLQITADEVGVLAARGRIRVLSAAIAGGERRGDRGR
jgi:DNA-directed RNA polymerase specialized sigma24 family protein